MDAGRLGPTFDLVDEIALLHPLETRVLLTRVRPGTRSASAARAGLRAQEVPLLAAEVRLRESYAAAVNTIPEDLAEYAAVLAELRTVEVERW
jgi:hypothetical protein